MLTKHSCDNPLTFVELVRDVTCQQGMKRTRPCWPWQHGCQWAGPPSFGFFPCPNILGKQPLGSDTSHGPRQAPKPVPHPLPVASLREFLHRRLGLGGGHL